VGTGYLEEYEEQVEGDISIDEIERILMEE